MNLVPFKLICIIIIGAQYQWNRLICAQELGASAGDNQSNRNRDDFPSIRILALFSGTKNELGIDHRLGRQILKLAVNRAKILFGDELGDIELTVRSDDTECTNLNIIPSLVAEQFYLGTQGSLRSSNLDAERGTKHLQSVCATVRDNANPECKANSSSAEVDADLSELNRYLRKQPAAADKQLPRMDQAHQQLPQVSERIDAIIGPSCDFLVDLVARMAAYWRCPIYSVASIGSSFARKDVYTTLTRLSPSIDHLSMFLAKTMEKFNWHHLAIIVDTESAESRILLENIVATIARIRYLFAIELKVFDLAEFSKARTGNGIGAPESVASSRIGEAKSGQKPVVDSGERCSIGLRKTLIAAQKVARVFLVMFNEQQIVRKLLICAHHLQMNNGEFTFLALNLGLKSAKAILTRPNDLANVVNLTGAEQSSSASSTRLRATQNFDWYQEGDEKDNLVAKQMFEALMVFSVELPISEEYNLFVEQALEMVQQEYPEVSFQRSSVGAVAAALHDSLLLAVAAHLRQVRSGANSSLVGQSQVDRNSGRSAEKAASAQEDLDEIEDGERRLGMRRAALFWNEHFADGLIAGLHINANGDQELDYVLSDFERDTGVMKPTFSYSKETRQVQLLPNGYVQWPKRLDPISKLMVDTDEPPPDEPECGFNDDAEHCVDRQSLYAALSTASVLALLVALIGVFSFFKYRRIKYQMQLHDYWWKIDWMDLHFINTGDGSLASNAQSIARAIQSGASVISAASSDGSHSMVSVMHQVKNKQLAEERLIASKNSSKDQAKPEKEATSGKPLNKRRAAIVPVIAVSGGDDKLATPNDAAEETATSVQGSGTTLMPASCLIRSEYSSVVRASNLAMYKDELVIVKQLNGRIVDVTRELLVELKSMREYINDNLAKFVGLCVEPERLAIVYEFCSRGSLQDLLLNEQVAMDWTLKYSIIGDVVSGLNFIHTTLLDYHGRLKSTNLVLDSRFTVKITDFGLQTLYSQLDEIGDRDEDEDEEDEEEGDEEVGSVLLDDAETLTTKSGTRRKRPKPKQADQVSLSVSQSIYNMESVSVRGSRVARSRSRAGDPGSRLQLKNRGAARYFWTAPEHLRDKNSHIAGSKKGDIYSLAIIFFELFSRKEPYFYGTNAKPHWSNIKRERRSLQPSTGSTGQVSSLPGKVLASVRKQSSSRSQVSETTPSLMSSLGRRAQDKLKRAGAQVSPVRQNQDASEASESASVKQVDGDPAGEVAPAQQTDLQGSISASARPMRLSVTTIGEEDPNEDAGSSVAGDRTKPSAGSTGNRIDADEILDQLRMGIEPEPVRPFLPNYVVQDINPKLLELMRACWAESAAARPSASQVRNMLRRITRGVASKNYLDNLLERLQSYAEDLERVVDGKSADIVEEKLRTEELLYQLVPKFVADRLKCNEPIIPQVFDGVTIFFSDIVGFEKYASVMSPGELVDLLNSIYSSFDSIISSFDVTKIETIIDQFLVASGISWQQAGIVDYGGPTAAAGGVQQAAKPPLAPISNSLDQIQEETGANVADEAALSGSKGKPIKRNRSLGMKRSLFGALNRAHNKQSSGDSSIKSLEESNDEGLAAKTDISTAEAKNPQATENQMRLIPAGNNQDLQSHYKRASAEQIARMALCVRDLVKSFHFRQNLSNSANNPLDRDNRDQVDGLKTGGSIVAATFNIRIGMHSGKVCAGIVGVKRPKFCLIGDTVNVASRMHTNSKANRIQISANTKELLEQVPGFSIEARGQIEVKGKGMMETFWLESSY